MPRAATGESVLFLGAANRDPQRWGPGADEFGLGRDPSGHVGFGMGIHQCIGQHVARRVTAIEPTAPATRHHNDTVRAWESIPVRVTLA